MLEEAWVIWHRYYDGSGSSVHRVYLNEARAKEDLELLKWIEERGGAGEWHIDKVPLVRGLGAVKVEA